MEENVEEPQVVCKDANEKKPEETDTVPSVSYFKLFSSTDNLNIALIIIGTIGALGSGVLLPLFSIVFGEFTDALSDPYGPGFMDSVKNVSLKFLYLGIAAIITSYFEMAAWMLAGSRQSNNLRLRLLKAALQQDIAYFDKHAASGGLIQGLNEDAMDVQKAISEKMGNTLHHVCTFVAGFIISFERGWDMTLVMLGCMPALLVIGAFLAKAAVFANQSTAKAYAEASGIAQQSITQVRTVAAYGREQATAEQYGKALEKPQKTDVLVAWIGGASFGSIMFVIYCSYAAGLFYGAYRVAAGAYTGGHVMSVLVASIMSSFALGQAVPNLSIFSKGCAAGGRIFAIIERKPVIGGGFDQREDAAGKSGVAVQTSTVRGEVEMRGVSFAYPARPDVMVLRQFNITVPAGKRVALVGSSGSGKSTVVGLVQRFYDPAEGAVLLDGVDIRQLPVDWLRSQMGLVNQEPVLFETTIFQNIALGRPGASAEEVEAAARAANAHEFISALPEGYQTSAGSRGTQLSGGQKQRIAIARAILRNPKVLLLDEATSALDSRSEVLVQEALDGMAVGRTTIVIAHRLSTVRNADCIVVAAAGAVVESGTHEELMAKSDGAYGKLVRLQQEAKKCEEENVKREVDEVEAMMNNPVFDMASMASQQFSPTASRVISTEMVATIKSTAVTPRHPTTNGSAEMVSIKSMATTRPPNGSLAVVVCDLEPQTPAAYVKTRSEAAEDPKKPYKVSTRRLLTYLEGQGTAMTAGCASSVASGTANPFFAYVLACMIGIFYSLPPEELKSRASFYCWMFFVIAIGAGLSALFQQAAFGYVAKTVAARIRAQLFGAILRQEIGWFDDPANSSGRLSSTLSTDAAAVRGAIVDVMGLAITNFSTLATGFIIAYICDWRMALLVTGILPFASIGMYLQYKYQSAADDDSGTVYSSANQAVTEAFGAIRIVHAYGLQHFIVGSFEKMLGDVHRVMMRQCNIAGAAYAFSQFIMFGMYSLAVYFMGNEITHGWTDFDSSLKAFLAIVMAAMGMAQSAMSFPSIGPARKALKTVFPILDRTPLIDSSSEEGAKPEPQALQGEIKFVAVTFMYPARPDVLVLRHFNLTVPAGKRVALVGSSGSGKSTVVGLVERFYDPAAGAVLLDGMDIRSINIRHLRSQIGLVSQEPLLFEGTIAQNILVGKPDASREEIVAAAEMANARCFVEALPEGYDTPVGEGGAKLSGGQKQRIAIARALVRKPKVLLLDEATSALDAESEAVVTAALDVAMKGRTSIIVAHRLSTVRNADRIAVMASGIVAESGTHDDLIVKRDGIYAQLVAAQQEAH